MKSVFIIILNYNGFEDISVLLPTLHLLNGEGYKLDTIIVDNGSNNKELDSLRKFLNKYPKIKLLETGRNLGFAGGNNVGIRYALKKGADLVLLLNNDTKIEINFLKRLFDLNADISSPVIKFRSLEGNWVYDYGGKINRWTGRTKHIEFNSLTMNKFNKEKNIDYVSGCCMLVNKEVFDKIGIFDEKYYFYFEDVDFCLRAKKAGFNIQNDTNGVIYHKLAGSIGRWSNKAIIYNIWGNTIFITKHLGWRRIIGYFYLLLLTIKIFLNKIRGK